MDGTNVVCDGFFMTGKIFFRLWKKMVSDLNILVWKWSKIAADFALQNMMETTLPDGLETSGRRVYH